jgi:hypothetical protein
MATWTFPFAVVRPLGSNQGDRMRRTTHAILVSLGLLFASSVASAVPFDVTLNITSGSQGAFSFSFLHSAETACEVISGVQFCKNGSTVLPLSGVLSGKQEGNVLSDITGTIFVNGAGGGDDITVTDGSFDFDSSAADTFGGELVTSTHGTFYFLDHTFAGSANSFDGTNLYLWGNNWNTGGKTTHPDPDWGLDLGIEVTPTPEASTLTLLVAGLGGLFAAGRPRLPARR